MTTGFMAPKPGGTSGPTINMMSAAPGGSGSGFLAPKGTFRNDLGGMATKAVGNAGSALNQPFNYNSAPKLPGVDDFGADRKRVESTIYGNLQKRLDEDWGKSREAFEQSAHNRGLDVGNPLFQKELQAFNDARNRAYLDASYQAFQGGAAEQNRLFDMGMGARQQNVSETNSIRDRPFQELSAAVNPALGFAGLESAEGMQQAGFGFEGGQNDKNRAHESGMQQAGFGHEKSMEEFRQNWQGKENELQRKLEETLGTQNSDFIRAILGQLGIAPVGGGSSPSDPSTQPFPGGLPKG